MKTLFFLLMTLSLMAEPKVKLVTNFPVDLAGIQGILQRGGIERTVVLSDLAEYTPAIVRDRSRLGRIKKKLHLDFPAKVEIEEDLDKIVFFNATVRYWRNFSLQKIPKEKLVIFLWEPPAVLPRMYSQNFLSKFGKVYTWNDALVDNKTFFKFNYPQLRPMIEDVVPFEQKKLCTLIATNLAPKRPSSLYGERVKAIEFFENAGEEGFEFYGRRWDPSRFKSYRGEIPDKTAVLKNYKFSICYENSNDAPGYITEKIFDCFAAGNVPIYWGAPNITDHIPKECFIDRRDFASLEDLHRFIKAMSPEEYEKYLANIRAFLKSDEAQAFSWETFEKKVCEAVNG